MKYQAFGLVEVVGSAHCILVVDQMLKTSDVEYIAKHTKCGGHTLIFMSGSVSAVQAAIDSVTQNPPCEICKSAVISGPSEETVRIVEGFRK